MAKTLHVYSFNHVWTVKREGHRAQTFETKQEAFASAVRSGRKAKAAQIVVHGKDGRILESRTYRMPIIQQHPKKGRLASKKIAAAVGKVVMDRLHADALRTRARTYAE